MRVYRFAFLVGVLVANGYACSGGEPEEPVSSDGSGSDAAAPADEAAPVDEPAPADEAPAPAPEPEAAPAPAPASAPAAAPDAGFDGAKVTRFVNTYAIHVRSAPDRTSPVVRHVKWGDKVEVVISGDWAKLGNNEYISAKYLSENEPTGASPLGKGAGKPAKAKKAGGAKKKKKATK